MCIFKRENNVKSDTIDCICSDNKKCCMQQIAHLKDSHLLALHGGLEKAMVTGDCCVGPDCCTEHDCVSWQTGY